MCKTQLAVEVYFLILKRWFSEAAKKTRPPDSFVPLLHVKARIHPGLSSVPKQVCKTVLFTWLLLPSWPFSSHLKFPT